MLTEGGEGRKTGRVGDMERGERRGGGDACVIIVVGISE